MARLIHLNGPSRVGKSTIARALAQQSAPMTVIDLDEIAEAIPDWRKDPDDAERTMRKARDKAAALIAEAAHRGEDSVLPQLVTAYDWSPWGEVLAQRGGVEYVEIALLATSEEQRTRLDSSTADLIRDALLAHDAALFDQVCRDFAWYLRGRPFTVRVDTTGLTADETLDRVQALIAPRSV